jgi:hypothetical protein
VVRPFVLLAILAAVALAPAAAAQTWTSAEVAAAAHATKPVKVQGLTIDRERVLRRPIGVPPTDPGRRAVAVQIPAKPEWRDDQGFRVAGGKLAYRQRF